MLLDLSKLPLVFTELSLVVYRRFFYQSKATFYKLKDLKYENLSY
jgi:hypothetical protein